MKVILPNTRGWPKDVTTVRTLEEYQRATGSVGGHDLFKPPGVTVFPIATQEKPPMSTPKTRPKKQTSSRKSTLAAKWMAEARESESVGHELIMVPTRVLKSLCASLISQDETKGQKRR